MAELVRRTTFRAWRATPVQVRLLSPAHRINNVDVVELVNTEVSKNRFLKKNRAAMFLSKLPLTNACRFESCRPHRHRRRQVAQDTALIRPDSVVRIHPAVQTRSGMGLRSVSQARGYDCLGDRPFIVSSRVRNSLLKI